MAKTTAQTVKIRQVALTPGALDLCNAAHYVALSASTVQNLIRQGDFPPPRKLSAARVGFLVRELDDWLDARPVSTLLPPPNTGHSNRPWAASQSVDKVE